MLYIQLKLKDRDEELRNIKEQGEEATRRQEKELMEEKLTLENSIREEERTKAAMERRQEDSISNQILLEQEAKILVITSDICIIKTMNFYLHFLKIFKSNKLYFF